MPTFYTILVIEDDAELAENICTILKLAKKRVLNASTGKAGVALAKQEHPDLILCDIMMPELDGYAVLHILNKEREFTNTPFIFLTAKSNTNDFRDGMNLGADDYIVKPFHGLDLLKVVEIRLKKVANLKNALNKTNDQLKSQSGIQHVNAEIEKLVNRRNVRKFNRKDLIFLEGQSAYELYYIHRGYVKTYKVNYEGKELITGFYHPGDFLGYIPIMEERPHHESAEVMEDSEVSIISKYDFLEILYSSKTWVQRFMKMLSCGLIEAESRMLDIAYQSVRQRVAGVLLKLEIENRAGDGPAQVLITMTRKDMSNIIGTTSESLNRTLADFKDEGLIEIRDDGITITNKAKLQRNCKQPTFVSAYSNGSA